MGFTRFISLSISIHTAEGLYELGHCKGRSQSGVWGGASTTLDWGSNGTSLIRH